MDKKTLNSINIKQKNKIYLYDGMPQVLLVWSEARKQSRGWALPVLKINAMQGLGHGGRFHISQPTFLFWILQN
jgi:hypothetical protein